MRLKRLRVCVRCRCVERTVHPASGRRRGHSAVELAVVIVIIGVFLSILMPILGRAREQGISSRCVAQLKDIGVGIGLYMQTFNGWFPASGDGADWFEKTARFMVNNDSEEEWIKAKSKFACLRADKSQRGFGRGSISYGWNEASIPYKTTEKTVVKNSTELILIGDSLPGPQAHILLPAGPVTKDRTRLCFRHLGRANVLSANAGNVRSLTPEEVFYEFPRLWVPK